ncbi:MAG: hypothetical protein PWP23_371 [Candidatus Sumerlaeota bacterium]|nr:hypothetical protein [Candidatus Sumerlaeota bacterium]
MIVAAPGASQRILNYPVLSALGEGLAVSGLLLLVLGFAGTLTSHLLATALLWGLLAYQRPLAYQIVLAAVLTLCGDVASGRLLGAGLPLLGAALLAANLFTDEGGTERWQSGHALFAVVACVASWGAALIAGITRPELFGPPESFLALLASLLVIAVAAGLLFCRAVWKSRRRREPSLARWSA